MHTKLFRWPPAALLVIAGSTHSLAAGPFGAVVELSSLNGTNGFVLNGIDPDDFSGRSVSAAGDVNGDGIGDLIIGATYAGPNGAIYAGESYVVFGGAGVGAGGTIELSSLNGTNGFVLNGVDASDQSGFSVSAAGDVNGDGIGDLIIGAHYADPNGVGYAGESYVVFGGAGVGAGGTIELSSLNGTNGFVLNGVDASDQSGFSVSAAGDVNGDGIGDLIIGASNADPNGAGNAGESYVVFGGAGVGAGGTIELSSLNGTNGFVCNGINAGDYSGRSVSAAGDVNGDGIGDLIIGASSADPNGVNIAGESYVVFGGAGVGAGGTIELSSLNGTNGFVLNGIDGSDRSGRSVSAAGDVNGDGIGDLIIGASNADPNGAGNAGESYVVFGGAGVGAGGTIELSSLNGTNGFVCNGINAGDYSGRSVSAAGDVNGDGIGDLIIGAYFADPNGANAAGESYVVFGGAGVGSGGTIELSSLNGTNGFVCNGIDTNDRSGFSVSAAGDVNGDGIDDLIIGAFLGDPNGASSGESYVVFGQLGGFVWDSPVGGMFDDALNWSCDTVPDSGDVLIDTAFGVTVTGPAGVLSIDSLTLGASAGTTILELQQNSLVTIADNFTIPSSAGISGSGILVTESAFTNDGLIEPSALTLFPSAAVSNNGEIKLETLSPAEPTATLEVIGALSNEASGEVLLRGAADLGTTAGYTNAGVTRCAFVNANISGPVTNTGADDGMGGFDPLGQVIISGASEVLFTDDVVNQSEIILTEDSSIVFVGSLSGNGVDGPGGGTAGTVFIEGGFNPGFPLTSGLTSFGGDVSLGALSVTSVEIGGTDAGTGHDQITTSANINLSGDLEVTLIDGFNPSCGDSFTIITGAAGLTGGFDSITVPNLPGGLSWEILTDANSVTLEIGLIADINGDGVGDTADLGILIAQFGTPGPAADLNGDGVVDTADLGSLIGSFGATCD